MGASEDGLLENNLRRFERMSEQKARGCLMSKDRSQDFFLSDRVVLVTETTKPVIPKKVCRER